MDFFLSLCSPQNYQRPVKTRSLERLQPNTTLLRNVPCEITMADGSVKTITVKCRIDTAIEIEYIEHGGVLHYVLRNLAKSAA